MSKGYAENNPYASNKLMYKAKKHFDGLAVAIQQGRDHGLAGYLDWRRFCNLTVYERYSDLDHVLDKDILVKLIKLYGKVQDIEAIVAGLTEESSPGSLLGPTFSCIMAMTFSKIRNGDRFWYENDLPPTTFKTDQLTEIRKTSLSKLLCLHSSVPTIQPKALIVPDAYRNAPIDCKSEYIYHLNISKFQSDSFSDKVLADALDYQFSLALKRTPHVYRDYRTGRSSGVRVHNSFLKPTNNSLHKNSQAHKLEEVTWEFIKTHKDDQKKGLLFLLSFVDVEEYLDKMHYPSYLSRCLMEDWRRNTPCDYTTSFRTFSGRCNNLDASGIGQLIDHDIGHTPVTTGEHHEILDCTQCDSNETTSQECFPISIPNNDPYFPPRHSITEKPACLAFTRSMAGQDHLGPRQQLNQVSSFLDLSVVYGPDECKARELRTFRRGLLKTDPNSRKGREFMAKDKKDQDCKTESGRCFLAGDVRSNEHPGLAVLHTILVRYHNNVARTLAHYNKHWDDERLFRESRKICIAVFQRIVYKEFLPVFLGDDAMDRFGLKLKDDSYFEGYDEHCDPAVSNEFANAAFRVGHSLIKPHIPRFGKPGKGHQYRKPAEHDTYTEHGQVHKRVYRGERLESIHLREHFFNPDIIAEGDTLQEILRGLVMVESEALDPSLSSEVTNHLFEDKHIKYSGLDLAALNIQRGRDHGLAGYIKYLDPLYHQTVTNFNDLKKIFSRDTIKKLKKLYTSVEDIDLFTGGLLEKPLPGGLVGSTFGYIIGMQFRALRRCDRYWHENSDCKVRFSEEQLCEIRKMTFAKLLCDVTSDIDELQEYILEIEDYFRNPLIKCENLDRIDFSKWREFKSCQVNDVKIHLGRSAPVSPCTHCTCTEDGPKCNSVNVKNCNYLVELYGANAVKDDQVCAAQCPWYLLSGKHSKFQGDGYYEHQVDDYGNSHRPRDEGGHHGHHEEKGSHGQGRRHGDFGTNSQREYEQHDERSKRHRLQRSIQDYYENQNKHGKHLGKDKGYSLIDLFKALKSKLDDSSYRNEKADYVEFSLLGNKSAEAPHKKD
ncbi:Peroxidasin [Nymphon striatum]|nr:Peroxidasin [Nymphon striatum]